jgi:hypothetical protein
MVTDRERGEHAFLTWGRVYDAVDPTKLEAALKRLLPTMGFRNVELVSVCNDLGAVRNYRYFHEGLLNFAARMAREPYETQAWAKEQQSDEALRKNLFLIGPPRATPANS